MRQPRGQRFSNVQVRNKATGAWAPLDPAQSYVLVTNDFVAAGRDGYATLGPVYAAGRFVNTYLLYTQTFVDYLTATGPLARPTRGAYSHQKVVTPARRHAALRVHRQGRPSGAVSRRLRRGVRHNRASGTMGESESGGRRLLWRRLARLGPRVPERTLLGHRARRLQRGRHSLGLPDP
jgi:hypothetical protein